MNNDGRFPNVVCVKNILSMYMQSAFFRVIGHINNLINVGNNADVLMVQTKICMHLIMVKLYFAK